MDYFNISPSELPVAYQYYFKRNFSRDELIEKILEELKKNPIYKALMAPYRNNEYLPKSYAEMKVSVLLDSVLMRDKVEFHDHTFKSSASKRFLDIQQKKLFDLQCQWRAELIILPEVESTVDFEYWSNNSTACPFLPPVTVDEVELYMEFLRSCNDDLQDEEWQNYDEFKINYQDSNMGIDLPEWYEFHNTRTGNGVLLTLPDIRGDKEDFYRTISHKYYSEKNSHEEFIPHLSSDEETREALIKQIESIEFQKMYKHYKQMQKVLNSQDEVETAFHFLHDLYQGVPIEANHDWRKALILAKNQYVNNKIAEEIPLFFEEYQIRISLGIAHEATSTPFSNKDFYQSLKVPVLEGRKLNGEPEDFNF